MSHHIGDTNKMISETPRTDAAYTLSTGAGIYELFKESQDIERELNAANDRIKRLEEMYEGVIGEKPELLGSNVMGLLKRELNAANQRIKQLEEESESRWKLAESAIGSCAEMSERIKRLEEAGDFLSRYLREMPYASDYLSQVDERILRISNWRRAKEDNL